MVELLGGALSKARRGRSNCWRCSIRSDQWPRSASRLGCDTCAGELTGLQFDRDTGKPKGFGFAEYHDVEVAACPALGRHGTLTLAGSLRRARGAT